MLDDKTTNEIVDTFVQYLHNLPYRKRITSQKTIDEKVRHLKRFLKYVVKGDKLDVDSEEFTTNTKVWLDLHGKTNTYYNILQTVVRQLLRSMKREDVELKHKDRILVVKDIPKDARALRLPSFEDIHKFMEYIKTYKGNKQRMKFVPKKYRVGCFPQEQFLFFYQLALCTGIRPAHLLKLTKGLFDIKERKIYSFKKEVDRKKFSFAFYSIEMQPIVEEYLAHLPNENSLLFDEITIPDNNRPEGKLEWYFYQLQKLSGIKMTAKVPRKIFTTTLRRANVRGDIVDILTSHATNKIVDNYYVEHTDEELRAEYDRAMLNLPILSSNIPKPVTDDRDVKIDALTKQVTELLAQNKQLMLLLQNKLKDGENK